MQMMQVSVPAGVKPGQQFSVQTPGGGQMQVTCPEGVEEGSAIQIQVPAAATAVAVATPQAFGQQLANVGAPPGNTFMLGLRGLYVRQYIELAEVLTGCETKNRYGISAIPTGSEIPTPPNSTSWV